MISIVTSNDVVAPVLVAAMIVIVFVTHFAAREQKTRRWRRCLTCHRWFDRHGAATQRPPILARFAIHGHGVCSDCFQAGKGMSKEDDTLTLCE
jgi:hypothetical protein